jgi:hypothetical protein
MKKHGISARIFQRLVHLAVTKLPSPTSPDLSPPHFFIWGHLKGQVYHNPHNAEELKTNSEDILLNSDHDTLHLVACNIVK